MGGKSFLDLQPEELTELQSLTAKGKEILGNDFDEELARRNAETKQQKKDKINDAFRRITDNFNSGAQALAKVTQQELGELDAKMATAEASIRQDIAGIEQDKRGKTYEEVLDKLRQDPQHQRATAEIEWLDLKMGKAVKGINPQLQAKINTLRQNASALLLRDPAEYQRQEKELKREFLKSHGIVEQSNSPKPQSQQGGPEDAGGGL